MGQLKLYLFGTPRFMNNADEIIIFRRRKALALIAFLVTKKQAQNRDKLCAMLWSDFDTDRARNNLRRELSLLNSSLGHTILEADRLQIWLNPDIDLWIDVEAYSSCLSKVNNWAQPLSLVQVRALEEALTLYQDDFMAGFGLSDNPLFDDWQYFESDNLRRSLTSVLQSLIQEYVTQKNYAQAIDHCHRWLATDPLHEPAHRQLLKLLAWSGQYSSALAQYDTCVNLLKQELGVLPEEQTITLYDKIRNREILSPELSHKKNTQEPATNHNLPAQVTSFIGRHQEMATLADLLMEKQARLITIWSSGGMGKTRLALEVASQQIGKFSQGIYLLDLTPLADSGYIIQAIADATGCDLHSDERDSKAQLLDYLKAKSMLLVMDNCEHLVSGIDIISDILHHAPDIRVIATSRETLSLVGETVLPLRGLDFETAHNILESDAGMLFVQTAQRIRPKFAVQSKDINTLLQICKITQGMPLAIMLAATWISTLTLSEIVTEMKTSIIFLETTLRDIPERHRSIQAVMDSTWKRLSDVEQDILMICSVFRGGFTREAIQKIAGATLQQQASLTNKALLHRDPDTERYQMHELLRQYAEKQLDHSGKVEEAQDKHAIFYLTWLSHLEADIKGRRQVAALNEFEADLENIRLAWEGGITAQNYAGIDLALSSIHHFFDMQTRHFEGVEWLELALEGLGPLSHTPYQMEYIRLDLRRLTFLYQWFQMPDDIHERLNQYLGIAEAHENHTEIGLCLLIMAYAYSREDVNNPLIETSYEASIAHFKKAGDLLNASNALHGLAFYQCELCGNMEIGIKNFHESLQLSRKIGDLNIILWSLIHIALRIPYKDLPQIQEYLDEAIELSNVIDSGWGSGLAYACLAFSHYYRGDFYNAELTVKQGLVGLESYSLSFEAGGLSILSRIASVGDVDYEKGRRLAEEAQTISKDFDPSWHEYYIPFAIIDIATHNYESARKYTHQALLKVSEYIMNTCGELLCISGMILVHDGKKERAVELFSLVFNHPHSTIAWLENWTLFNGIYEQLKTDLNREVYNRAWEQGKSLDIKSVVNELQLAFDGIPNKV